jgi:hypothetical protein
MDERVAERNESLWMLTVSPTIWAAHFGLCYVTGAIWCAKATDVLAPLGGLRTAVLLFTGVALAGIAITGWVGYRAHSYGAAELPHDDDTPEDRHRFMGFATLLLSGLSALAVTYAALVVVFVETCQ